MREIMKKNQFFILILVLFIFSTFSIKNKVYAQDLSLSIQQWSFFNNKNNQSISEPGQHIGVGFVVGIDKNIEADFGVIGMITPRLADTLMGYVSFGYSLLDKRWITSKIPPNWINSQIEAGFIGGVKHVYSFFDDGGKKEIAQIFIKITPLILGNPFYIRRDKLFGLGLAYDCFGGKFSVFLNLISFDFRIYPLIQ